MQFDLEIEIRRPPEDVFALLTDLARLPEWQSSAVSAEAEGPLGRGATIRESRRFMGREFRTKLEVTAYEPGRRFDIESVEAPLPLAVSHTLEASVEGTKLHVATDAKVSGLKRFAAAAGAKRAEAEFRKDFERLKALLESG